MKTYQIATIPGDGIGKEVIPESLKVLEAVAAQCGFQLKFDHYDYSCEHYIKHGKMMPDDGLDRLRDSDSIFLGAVGYPGVPDHVSLWGLLIPIRRSFQQYVNLRPVRLLKGVSSPLKNPGKVDFYIVRENNEGEYSSSEKEAANLLMKAIEDNIREGRIRTRDLGGTASTQEVTTAVIEKIKSSS